MFAVIKTGGKQYRVAEDQVLKVEGIKGEPGTIVQIGDVLMLGGDTPQLGTPMVAGASVAAEIIEQGRGPKVIAFKKRRRKNSRRKRGHRQDFVLIRISEILTEGAQADQEAQSPSLSRKAKARRGRGRRGQAKGAQESPPRSKAAAKGKKK